MQKIGKLAPLPVFTASPHLGGSRFQSNERFDFCFEFLDRARGTPAMPASAQIWAIRAGAVYGRVTIFRAKPILNIEPRTP